MDCSNCKEKLSAYLDKALTEEEMQQVRRHLEECASCLSEYQALEQTVHLLSSLEEVIPPASFRRELRRKLEAQVSSKGNHNVFSLNKLIPRWLKNGGRPAWMPIAVALVAMVIILPFLGDSLRTGSAQKAADNGTADTYLMRQNESLTAKSEPALDGQGVAPAMPPAPEGRGGGEAEKQNQASFKNFASDATGAGPFAAEAGPVSEPQAIERKIIKNADVSLLVDDYNAVVNAIKERVASLGGYVANESVNASGPEGIRNGNMQVRIPQQHFENFLSGMEGLGKVNNRNVYTQDVTEEYVDIESRLRALRTKEERLLAILEKSGQLSDILAVENELANTRAQLESLQGRMRYLDNRTEYSSIGINIQQAVSSSQQISTTGLAGVWIRAKEAFIKAINNILVDTGKLIVFVSSALPYLVLALLVALGVWRWLRNKGV